MATMIFGYDVEAQNISLDITKRFLKQARKIHCDLNAPCTMFICGKTLENNVEEFQSLQNESELFDFQQHTYSHKLLKTNVHVHEDGKVTIDRSGSLDEIQEEVNKTNALLMKHLSVKCIGLTAPTGCYMGLMDRPDILGVLHNLGIRFVRSYHLNKRDFEHWEPLPFEVQPFWYEPQGFPDILEFPFQGYMDCVWLDLHPHTYGYDKREEYLNYVKVSIDYIIDHNLTWTYNQHDWSSITDRHASGIASGIAGKQDPEMKTTRKIIEYALKKGARIVSYREYYHELLKSRK